MLNPAKICAIMGVTLILSLQIYVFFYYFYFYLQKNINYNNLIILTCFEIILTGMSYWSFLTTSLSDPGYESLIFSTTLQDIEKKKEIEINSILKKKKLNSVQRFLLINGDDIKIEDCDLEILHRTSKMSLKKLKSEKSKIHLEFINKKTICQKCYVIKMPRTHHCSSCKRCVNRFDHHCVWIGNCVGLFNMKFFLQFLFYSSIGSFFNFLVYFINYVYFGPKTNLKEDNIYKGVCFSALILALAIGLLFVYQFCGVLDNVTTLEDNIENFRNYNCFDMGKKKNLLSIFGKIGFIDFCFPLKEKDNYLKNLRIKL